MANARHERRARLGFTSRSTNGGNHATTRGGVVSRTAQAEPVARSPPPKRGRTGRGGTARAHPRWQGATALEGVLA